MQVRKAGVTKCDGFTLTEIAIVLGVIGLIIGGVWTAAASLYQAKKTNQAVQQATQILNNYRSLYQLHGIDAPTLSDLSCIGVNGRLLPSEMVTTGATTSCATDTTYAPISPTTNALQTPWGSTTYMTVLSWNPPQGIALNYFNLSTAECDDLAQALTYRPDVFYESINGTARYVSFVNEANNLLTFAQIKTACNAGSGSSQVEVVFKLK